MNRIKLNKYKCGRDDKSFVCVNGEPNKKIDIIKPNYMRREKNSGISISGDVENLMHEKIHISNDFNKDLLYTINVNFGEKNSISSELVIDTGSSDLWISKRAISKYFINSGKPNDFKPNEKFNKTTGKKIPIMINYGSGIVGGNIYSDKVSIDNLAVNVQSFGIMNNMSLGVQINGILGLGFNTLANKNNTPIMLDNLFNNGIIKNRIFGFNSNEITIGEIDEEYKKQIKYVGLYNNNGYWNIKYNKTLIADKLMDSKYESIIADTGCSAIIVAENDYNNILKCMNISEDEVYDITEDKYNSLPNITFNIGTAENNIDICIKPEHYMIKNDDKYELLITYSAEETDTLIMGDPLFRAYYCVFDMDNKQMGFCAC